MNSCTHNQINTNQVSKSFLEQLYSIIDTRLQYVEYHTQAFLKACLPDFSNYFTDNSNIRNRPKYQEGFLDTIESYSKIKRQLLFLRSKISIENAWRIYHLLYEDCFQKFEENELKIIISPNQQER